MKPLVPGAGALLLAALVAAWPLRGASGDAAVAPLPLTISVEPQTVGSIGPGFVGLSYEKATLSSPLFSGDNAALIGLFRRLGPGVLRIGGNEVDRTHWRPDGPGRQKEITAPSDVDRLARFAEAAGWPVIYGVNLATSNPGIAADEAAYAAKVLGSKLVGIEIGNEPDLYNRHYFARTWNSADYLRRWRAFADAIERRTPGLALVGPATANNVKWFAAFAAAAPDSVKLLTHHYYRGNGQAPSSTVAVLVSWPDTKLERTLGSLRKAADAAGRPFRMGETNSFYHGGRPDVSDAYASALWVIDDLFTLAEGGCSGANFHGGGNGTGYTPIADRNGKVVGPRPEFYGMYLFNQAGVGAIHACRLDAGGRNVTAYAVVGADRRTSVLIDNKSAATLAVTLRTAHPARGAAELLLSNTSLDTPGGTTLQAVTIQPNGGMPPIAATPLPISRDGVAVTVPPISAILVRID